MTMVKFCGHYLSEGQMRAAPSKLEAIAKWTPDIIKTITHLREFFGLCKYYSQCVQNFAEIALLLSHKFLGRKPANNKIE